MKVLRDAGAMRAWSFEQRAAGRSLGLVPTMGAFHEGHLSLMRASIAREDATVVSIFVNPTQFAPHEDFDSYPRTFEADCEQAEALGVDAIYAPAASKMYLEKYATYVTVEGLQDRLCGISRQHFFRGVATVVAKLFNAVTPDRAYFGQKDAQQCAVIKRMARDLDFPVEIVTVPTVREPDGLAMSSRNIYLTSDERRAALCLSRGLADAASAWSTGQRDAKALKAAVCDAVDREPLLQLEYVSLANAETMVELTGTVTGSALLSLAARASKARLIDNVVLGSIQSAT